MPRSLVLCLLTFAFAATAHAQPAPRALDHDAYDVWNHLDDEAISDDGRWVRYTRGPMDGDGTLRVVRSDGSRAFEVARGKNAAFSADGGYVAFLIAPPRDSVRAAKLAEKKPDEMPKDSLGLLDLATGTVVRVAGVKSFKVPEEAGSYVAYLLEKAEDEPAAEADTTATETQAEEEAAPPEDDEKKKDKKDGTPLVLRELATGTEHRFENVLAYLFSEDGRWLVYAASSKDGAADGVFAVETATGTATPVMTGEGNYTQLTLDEAGAQGAFLSNRDDYAADQPSYTLYRWRLGEAAPVAVAREGATGLPDGWWIGEHGDLDFSDDGARLFFGTAPRPEPAPEDSIPDDEKVKVDVWSWTDDFLMPMQIERKGDDEKRTYLAVAHLDDGRLVQLADEAMPEIELPDDRQAARALGISDVPYRQLLSWDWPRYYDAYVVDVETGQRQRVLEKVQERPNLSPGAGYIHYWDRDALAWFAVATAGGAPVNLTASIPHPVHNERHDWPYLPDPYGAAGWTDDDAAFLVYDKHDVWATDPAGGAARSLTEGRGRAENLRFRLVDLEEEEAAIDRASPLLLSAFDLDSKGEGFYRDRFAGTTPPARLVFADQHFSTPDKADDAGRLLFTRETFRDFPNLWTADLDFSTLTQLSDANPQQADFRWGTAEPYTWTSLDGTPLDGILYKPDGFDPARQYPMMVYFYEKNAENLHRHWAPEPHRSIINFTFYVSRGYLVFVPDIPYKIGYPGESALQAVMPGVTALIAEGFVDADNIGVQGHSWGGYQIAYMVTRTNLFKAAEAGAPVSNMFSAYGGIRWGTGMSRMFQYEKTQSRIGGSIWEYPLRYLENSPIFFADRIETPLLIMHNDKDGAVPWYQGIELFVALRRLGKPVWMINYNDEPHWPTTYPNKRDWAIRMQQFFDHYLMGAPAPQWMIEGVPAVRKGRTLGLEPATTPASSN